MFGIAIQNLDLSTRSKDPPRQGKNVYKTNGRPPAEKLHLTEDQTATSTALAPVHLLIPDQPIPWPATTPFNMSSSQIPTAAGRAEDYYPLIDKLDVNSGNNSQYKKVLRAIAQDLPRMTDAPTLEQFLTDTQDARYDKTLHAIKIAHPEIFHTLFTSAVNAVRWANMGPDIEKRVRADIDLIRRLVAAVPVSKNTRMIYGVCLKAVARRLPKIDNAPMLEDLFAKPNEISSIQTVTTLNAYFADTGFPQDLEEAVTAIRLCHYAGRRSENPLETSQPEPVPPEVNNDPTTAPQLPADFAAQLVNMTAPGSTEEMTPPHQRSTTETTKMIDQYINSLKPGLGKSAITVARCNATWVPLQKWLPPGTFEQIVTATGPVEEDPNVFACLTHFRATNQTDAAAYLIPAVTALREDPAVALLFANECGYIDQLLAGMPDAYISQCKKTLTELNAHLMTRDLVAPPANKLLPTEDAKFLNEIRALLKR